MTGQQEHVDPAAEILAASRPERRDAAEHRRQILECARHLFAAQGIDSVSMHQIAQAAGVGQGTLYRRYGHKGDLCFDLLRESGERFWADLEAYLDSNQDAVPPLERLDGLIDRLLHFVEEKAPLLSAIDDAFLGQRRHMQYENPFYRWIHDRISGLLQEAEDRGDLIDLDVAFTTDALLATMSVDLYLFQRRERGFSLERIHAAVRRIYLTGLSRTSSADITAV